MIDPDSPSLWNQCRRCRKFKPGAEFEPKRGTAPATACMRCRDRSCKRSKQHSQSEKGRATQARHRKTDKWKATKAKHKQTDKCQETAARYIDSGRRAAVRKEEYDRVHSDPGRHLEHAIVVKVGKMINGKRKESETVMSYTEFSSNRDLCDHLESTFEPGMSFANFGKHRGVGPRVWNVGHRIARFHYDANNPEDVRRCWLKQNIFAQWGKENLSTHAAFPDESTLIALQTSWPVAWNDVLPSREERVCMERAVFARAGSWAW